RHMPNGDALIIGREVDETKEISHVVAQALALGLLPAFCLCLLAGAWLSVRAQKRVEEVNQRVQRIIAGDLRERLPYRNLDAPGLLRDDGKTIVRVTDTGPGEEEREAVLRRFYGSDK